MLNISYPSVPFIQWVMVRFYKKPKLIEELRIAAAYAQKVRIKLQTGEVIEGKAQLSGDPNRTKVRTDDGPLWIPYEEIEFVERLIKLN
ncbi:hypothetical protein AAXB25_04535 [Paenibacillus lautus]|uniref:hypothetical protein n=1 Tax=Paenibacillus lautus TaxID=1401 RepID=UPI003D2D390D